MSAPLVRLPSLDLVRGFVAVGRRMSITLAAQDLCLTQSAVSRQIHALEDALGLKLLVRGHRSIAFTPEGERLFRSADSAVQQLQDVVGELKGPTGRQTVTITSTMGLTGLWLMPRLGNFLQRHPEIEVRVSANSRAVDLKAEGIDLAIRYGAPGTLPEGAELLFEESIVPVAHPSLGLTALDSPEALAGQVLLEFDGPFRPWLQWSEWLASQGKPIAASLATALAKALLATQSAEPYPSAWQTLAEVHLRIARAQQNQKAARDEHIAAGLAAATQVFISNPNHALGLATQGALYLLRAQTAQNPPARQLAAQAAAKSLRRALNSDPFLWHDYVPLVAEAGALAPPEIDAP